MIDKSGQISGEYLFIAGVLIIIVMISAVFIAGESELNTAMTAARIGVNDGVAGSSAAVYPDETFNEYEVEKSDLLIPYSVEIVNVSYAEFGVDENYGKEKIQFTVYATTSKSFSAKELDSIGERINYYLRKSVAVSFNSTSTANNLYNPVFSPHYIYTTANVKWV